MGFGDIASQMIMLIAVLSASVVIVVAFNNQIAETSSSVETRQNNLDMQLRTDINVELLDYNSTSEQVIFYIKNTGQTRMRISEMSFYINGAWIANNSDRSIMVLSDTDTINTGIWDPGEVIYGIVNQTLSSDTHTLRVVTPYLTDETEEFST